MFKFFNIFFLMLILFFTFSTFNYYTSNQNLKVKDFNRKNINQIINDKISNLPVLDNDTNNVIYYNNSLNDTMQKNAPRSFWNLLKIK